MRRIVATAAIILCCCAPIFGQANPPAPPPPPPGVPSGPAAFAPAYAAEPAEMLCQRADLVVVGKVVELIGTRDAEIKLPEWPKARAGKFEQIKVKVDKLLRNASGQEIMITSLELLADAGTGIQKDKTYVLILRTTQPGQYFLPAGMARPATEAAVKRFENACNIERWPWGKEVDGLQLAFLAEPTTTIQVFNMNATNQARAAANVGFTGAFALRNTSSKVIVLSTNAKEKHFSLSVAAAGNAPQECDLYQELLAPKRIDSLITEIKPGHVVFLNAWGQVDKGSVIYLKLDGGKHTFAASYFNKLSSTGDRSRPLWTGKIEAKPVEVEIKDTGIRPMPLRLPG